ncbi:MAG: DUF58 domain-containing protein [Myxococcota bacterium]
MLHPTPRTLVVILATTVVALLPALIDERTWPVWTVCVALVSLFVGIDAVLVPGRRQLRLEADWPRQFYVGSRHDITLTVHGLSDANAVVRVEHSEEASSTVVEASSVDVRIVPERRGELQVWRVWLRHGGPLGLVRRVTSFPVDEAIPILPDVPKVQAQALQFFGGRDGQSGLKVERFAGDGSEFDALREFMPGMDRRTIDWKASARHTKLLAREFRAERNHQIILAVDTGRLMAEPIEGVPRLDHAVHAALLLAWVSLRHGDRAGLFTFADRPDRFVPPRPGMRALASFVDQAARLDYSDAETNFTLGLTTLMSRLSRRSLVVVLTDFVDTVTAELMVENLARVARRHLTMFVSLRDPRLDAIATAPLHDFADVDRSLVAESFLAERALVNGRLDKLGVLCVDASPAIVGPTLVNRYLDIARRERI